MSDEQRKETYKKRREAYQNNTSNRNQNKENIDPHDHVAVHASKSRDIAGPVYCYDILKALFNTML